MAENEWEQRLAHVESVLERINSRIDSIENRLAIPPISAQKTEPKETRSSFNDIQPNTAPRYKKATPTVPKLDSNDGFYSNHPPNEDSNQVQTKADDFEYKVGINGLLRGGVIVVLCAFLFLVALFIGRGMLSPSIQFGGELAFCAALIGIGIWKREEKEDFGQLMIGLGSCGFYASFAGAHVYKNLISSETLVGLFFILSFANLGISEFWKSKSFFVIGFLGGLTTALLPMMKNNHTVDLILHFLILVPSAVVVSRNKWAEMGILMWLLSSAALFPICISNLPFWTRALSLHLSLVVCLISFAKTGISEKFDPDQSVLTVSTIATGLLLIAIDSGKTATLQAFSLAAATILVALVFRKDHEIRYRLLGGGLISFVLFAPMGFSQFPSTVMYLLETTILIGFAIKFTQKHLFSLSLFTTIFALIGYFLWIETNPRNLQELCLIAISAINVGGASYYLIKKENESGWVIGALLLSILTLRTAILLIPEPQNTATNQDSVAMLTGLLCTTIIAILGKRLNKILLSYLSIPLFFVFGQFLFFNLVRPLADLLNGTKVTQLENLPGVLPGCTFALITLFTTRKWLSSLKDHPLKTGFMTAVEVLIAIVIARIPLELSFMQRTDFATTFLVTLNGLLLFSIAKTVKNNTSTSRWFGVPFTLYLTLQWIVLSATKEQIVHPFLLHISAFLLFAHTLTLYLTRARKEENEGAWPLLLIIIPGFLNGWIQPILQSQIGLKSIAAWTASLTLSAIILIITGFLKNDRPLRYTALILFGLTVIKVFLVDLAALDSMVRVIILMLLGFAMISGGYGYISMKKKES